MAWSLAITTIAACVTASGMTGLTLPGMIDEPACRGGQADLADARVGPEESSRRSPAIFSRFAAQGLEDAADLDEHVGVLRGLDEVLRARQAQAGDVAQVLDGAEDELPRRRQARADGRAAEVHHAQPLLALVDPPAVAGERLGVGRHLAPSVVSTASCICVRPTLTTCANAFSLRWNSSSSATTSRSSARSSRMAATFSAVG